VPRLQGVVERHSGPLSKAHPAQIKIKSLSRFLPLSEGIEGFWLDPASRENETWKAHREINMVMLATSLAPDTFLGVY